MNKTVDTVLNGALELNAGRPAMRAVRNAATLVGVPALVCGLVWTGWEIAQGRIYTSGSSFGYSLGLAGGSMMLALLLYPLRKHIRPLRHWGSLKYWFRMHMICGIAGPLLILFHSTFRLGSFNATVAVSCMLLVALSGVVGRFIYRKIHHGLYGSRATREDLQKSLLLELARIEPLLSPVPTVRDDIDGFSALAERHPAGMCGRIWHFMSLGWHRQLARQRIAGKLSKFAQGAGADAAFTSRDLARFMHAVDLALEGMQKTAQFAAYERLFSLWHILHIPFVYMFVISAVVHVVAVHTY